MRGTGGEENSRAGGEEKAERWGCGGIHSPDSRGFHVELIFGVKGIREWGWGAGETDRERERDYEGNSFTGLGKAAFSQHCSLHLSFQSSNSWFQFPWGNEISLGEYISLVDLQFCLVSSNKIENYSLWLGNSNWNLEIVNFPSSNTL